MFHRFHDAKNQESDIMQDNESRSNTPVMALDGRTMFTCSVSPMAAHESLVTSYPTSLSPSQPSLSQNTQIMCNDNQILDDQKYVTPSPPEAHRYVVEVYRTNETDSFKYIEEPPHIDVYRQPQIDIQREPLEIQRIRLEDHHSGGYRRSLGSYPVDLQRVPEYSIEQTTTNSEQQRLESEISRLSDLIRSESQTRGFDQEEIDIDGFQNTHTLDYRIVTEDYRDASPPRMIQDSQRINFSDPQRMVQESILKGFSNTQRHSEMIRIEPRIGQDNVRYTSPEITRVSRFDLDINSQCTIIQENLRVGAETPHSIGSDNLRVTPDASNMVPENLCMTDPQHVMPENLHINMNGLSPNSNVDHLTSQTIAVNSPIDARTHYDSHIIIDPSRSYRDNMRIQSPQYVETYTRNNVYSGNIPVAPPTPAPSVPPMSDTPTTPITGRYYSTDSFIPSTPHSSQSMVYSNQFQYNNEIQGDKLFRQNMLTIEERIERGYEDIKPFDQEYPASMQIMHLPHESLPPPTMAKLPRPKKPKETKPLRAPVIHKCVECDRNFKNSTQLKNHMWRHTGDKPFTCDDCGSKFTQQGNLRAHRRIHTGERPYECLDCKACFTQLSTLKTHQKIHSNERPYKCSHCEAAFRQIANLKTHQVTHTGERPHQCDLCDKAFTQKSNLKAHKNRVHNCNGAHSGSAKRGRRKTPAAIRSYACTECAAQFTIMNNLKSHMRLHSGEKCFECEFCATGFTQRSNLKTHMQRIHGKNISQTKRRIRCDECPAVFRLKRCLKLHKSKVHAARSLKIKLLRASTGSTESGPELSEDEFYDDADLEDGYSDFEGAHGKSDNEILDRKVIEGKQTVYTPNCHSKLESAELYNDPLRAKYSESDSFVKVETALLCRRASDDKKTIYTPSDNIKLELIDNDSRFEYPGSPEVDAQITNLPLEVKLESYSPVVNKDNQNDVC